MPDKLLKSTFQWGVGCEVDRYAHLSRSELLAVLRRYDAALRRIVEQPREQEALIAYREKTRQDVSEGDKQVRHAYRETAKIAAAALCLSPRALL